MRTQAYEGLFILKAAGTEQDQARTAAQLEETVRKVGGTIESAQPWGRRRLAFPIGREREGHYQLLRFRLETQQLREIDRLCRLNEAIVRFLILSVEEQAPGAEAAVAAAPVRREVGDGEP